MAPVDVFNVDGLTPLHFAALRGHTSICQLLLEGGEGHACQGGCPDVQDHSGETPLMLATKHGHHEVVKVLLAPPAGKAGGPGGYVNM